VKGKRLAQWEINVRVGLSHTAIIDHLIIKGIVGRRFDWYHHRAIDQESMQQGNGI